jgi:hypothetical protein
MEKYYENLDRKERKLLYCIVLHGQALTPQPEVYILMILCIESYKTKVKFLPEMKKMK